MAKETTQKILQTKLALSERAFRLGEASRLSIFKAIKSINDTFKTPAERRAIAGDRAIECRGFRIEDNVIGIYLVGYVPDDAVGIVPHNAEDLSLLPPPDNADFLDGELMALVSDETIIVCRLGLYEGALNSYVQLLGPKAGLDKEDAHFIFKNRTDIDKLKMIQDDGVASIRFEGAANQASVDYATAGTSGFIDTLVGSVWDEIQALTYADKKTTRDTENLKVEVYLKFDKRSGTAIDQEEIKEVAEQIADADDGFEIMTLSGRRITPIDVLLNKKINVKRYGKSVAFNEVFAEMLKYYGELTAPNEAHNEG